MYGLISKLVGLVIRFAQHLLDSSLLPSFVVYACRHLGCRILHTKPSIAVQNRFPCLFERRFGNMHMRIVVHSGTVRMKNAVVRAGTRRPLRIPNKCEHINQNMNKNHTV